MKVISALVIVILYLGLATQPIDDPVSSNTNTKNGNSWNENKSKGEPECEATIHDVNAPVCDFTPTPTLTTTTTTTIERYSN